MPVAAGEKKVGRSVTYRLNPSFGWKASAKNHLKAIDNDLRERMKARNMTVVDAAVADSGSEQL